MFVKKEALLSTQIEGTQATFENILAFEQSDIPDYNDDIEEVVNYIAALNYGLKRLKKFPMSLRLIQELHKILVDGVRGKTKTPGQFKKVQNWIGPAGTAIQDATFVPPTPLETILAMQALEEYLHNGDSLPPLIDCALIHYQFETIHPFLDGNGRLGRLLITFYLYWKNIIDKPLLYLSFYFKKHRQEYYDRLMLVRQKGDFEQWVSFFLDGVIETSQVSILATKKILELQSSIKEQLWQARISSPLAIKILDQLFYTPIFSSSDMQKHLESSYQMIMPVIAHFERLGIIKEITGKKRGKRYQFAKYLKILSEGTKPL